MRSLVVAQWAPWPTTSGSRQRSANVIAALAELGDVDVFLLADDPDAVLSPPPGLGVARVGMAMRARARPTTIERIATLVPGTRPAVVRRQEHDELRKAFATWSPGAYDLAWFIRIESWLALGSMVDSPAIVDYDDLRDQLVRSRFRSTWPDLPAPVPLKAKLRSAAGERLAHADARAWSHLQRRVARDAAAVVVCSELDRARLGLANAAVVGNGVDLPDLPVGRACVGTPPTLCLQGSLSYTPNADAATLLVRDVMPRVRAHIPDAEIRLVGQYDDRVAALAAGEGVTLTGVVDDVTDELASVDVIAVPLRQGGGTRIKVIEGLAHRVPVVATTIAVEGLDTVNGTHLLVADEPDTFAASCVSLLRDQQLRTTLVDAGERLVRERYGWKHARAAVIALAERAAERPG